MPRITVVIPALGSIDALENSLVSALEHRPLGCDVIVVLNQPYADPYALDGEVRFIKAPPWADVPECIGLGIAAAKSGFVFVLLAGCEVAEGWCEAALKHFNNPRVAAVAPRLVAATDPTRVLGHGVRLAPGGKRCVHTGLAPNADERSQGIWAPTIAAGFYRVTALNAVGGFSGGSGGPLADVRLAAALRRGRWLVAWEPKSQISAPLLGTAPLAGRVNQAWHAQRLAVETADLFGAADSLTGHMRTIFADFFRSLPAPIAFVILAARMAALMTAGWGAPETAPATILAAGSIAPTAEANAAQEPGIRRVDRAHGIDRHEPVSQQAKRG